MVLVMSILLFVLVTCTLYLFGVKFWANPKSMVARAMGQGPRHTEPTLHPSLAFHQLLTKIGDLVPASPADLTATQKRLYLLRHQSSIRGGVSAPGSVPQLHSRPFTASKLYPWWGFHCSHGC